MKTPRPRDRALAERMSRQRAKDTKLELDVRKGLHAMGLRFRIHFPGVDCRYADIAFPRARLAIFIDGCFWHVCPEHGSKPKHNREWWDAKLSTNVDRDRDTNSRYEACGWTVLRFWEHVETARICAEISRVLKSSRSSTTQAQRRGVALLPAADAERPTAQAAVFAGLTSSATIRGRRAPGVRGSRQPPA